MDNDNPKTPTPISDDEAKAEQLADSSKHAANVTREQIKHIYEQSVPNQPQPAASPEQSKAPTLPTNSPYRRTHKDNFDWRQYHSAWQEYYQEYYRRYYNHLDSKKQIEQPGQPQSVTGDDSARVEELKKDVVTQVKRQATKIKRSHHFWPLVTAVLVGTGFLFIQFNTIVFAQVQSYISPGAIEGKNLVITDPTGSTTVSQDPRLIIPKINVDIPLNFDITTTNEADIQNALQTAAVHYKLPEANALPGQFGNAVILGHSSNDVFAKGNYKFAFVLTDQLVPGDTFYIHYKGTRYTYKVTEKKTIAPQDLSALQVGTAKPMATLVTCTPPGTSINRLLVFAEQISPDPAGATQAAAPVANAPTQTTIPGNDPTLLEQLWNLFF